MDDYDRLLKILMIGDYGTGKLELMLRYCEGTYAEGTEDFLAGKRCPNIMH
jgi:GTPase SAR1 family protein